MHLSTLSINCTPFQTSRIFESGYGKLDKNFYVTRVKNNGFQSIVYTLSVQGRIILENGNKLILKPGSVFISTATGQGHREETYGDELWEMLWFSTYNDSPNIVIHSTDYQFVENINLEFMKVSFLSIFTEELYSDLRSKEAIGLHERLFLPSVERSFGLIEPINMRENRRRFQTMWLQVSNKPEKAWTVSDLCNYINLSRSQLSRICKDLYKKAPGEMVKSIKIDYAKVLLRNTTYPISLISDKIGYENSNNFSTAFKTIAKQSPQAFRKEYNALRYFK
jgi:AraC-like DNA-binding protein